MLLLSLRRPGVFTVANRDLVHIVYLVASFGLLISRLFILFLVVRPVGSSHTLRSELVTSSEDSSWLDVLLLLEASEARLGSNLLTLVTNRGSLWLNLPD